MKNMKKWLPILLIALVTMFLTGCKVDWTTVSATETNKFAFGAFWFLVHIVFALLINTIGFVVVAVVGDSNNVDLDFVSFFLVASLVGLYIFHFFHMNKINFNLLYITQLGLILVTSLVILRVNCSGTGTAIIHICVATGIAVTSLLANIYTGKYLEPFAFSCSGYLSIIAGSIVSRIRDDDKIGVELITPVLCFAAMIFGVVHAKVPNYCYMISIQCAIITALSAPLMLFEAGKVLSFVVSVIGYIWVFVAANMYNSESFGKSLGISFIGWGALLLLFIIAFIISARKAAKEAAARAAIEAQKAKQRAAEKQRQQELAAKKKAEEEATAKIKAEEEAKAKAEAESKAKQEVEEKAKAEAEAKAKQLTETKAVLEQLEEEVAAKKAQVASLGLDAQGIVQKAKLNKEIKDLEPQIETLKAEVERLSK